MINKQLQTYLIAFLAGIERVAHDNHLHLSYEYLLGKQEYVGYTRDPEEMKRYRIIIYPSPFFDSGVYGTEKAEPQLPLTQWRDIPLLFGEAREEWINDGQTLIIYADILASTYYLVSRYEEMYRRHERDKHGRFPAKASLPVRADFLHRPIVDEYAEQLRNIISEHKILNAGVQLEQRPQLFRKINLTHDVDQPYLYRGPKGYVRAVIKDRVNPFKALHLAFGAAQEDRFNTFRELTLWNRRLKRLAPEGLVDTIYFLKTPASHPLDKPNYNLRSPYMRSIIVQARRAGIRFGLHCSYASGINPELIARQRQVLQTILDEHITMARHHYLSLREPEDMHSLYAAGIRHDYTMGYADRAGFRLGTCRPVKFINPNTRSLTELVLHPLTMMDVTLTRPDFMNMSYPEALAYAKGLIDYTARYNGELNLLWHNEQLSPEVHPWLGNLYQELLHYIASLLPVPSSVVS